MSVHVPSWKDRKKSLNKKKVMYSGNLKKAATLTNGQSFGELALIYDQVRQATVVCEKDSHFAVLE